MKYFKLAEFERSETAKRLGIDNSIPEFYVSNINKLVDNVLDPLREAYGKPIRVTSGYRCTELNRAVGGAGNSQHLYGMAADIQGTPNTAAEVKTLFSLVRKLGIEYDQAIFEKNRWLHISYNEGKNRKQAFRL